MSAPAASMGVTGVGTVTASRGPAVRSSFWQDPMNRAACSAASFSSQPMSGAMRVAMAPAASMVAWARWIVHRVRRDTTSSRVRAISSRTA